MASRSIEPTGDADYAMALANESYGWYRTHAIHSRRVYRLMDTLLLATSAAIPVSASIVPESAFVPGVHVASDQFRAAAAEARSGNVVALVWRVPRRLPGACPRDDAVLDESCVQYGSGTFG